METVPFPGFRISVSLFFFNDPVVIPAGNLIFLGYDKLITLGSHRIEALLRIFGIGLSISRVYILDAVQDDDLVLEVVINNLIFALFQNHLLAIFIDFFHILAERFLRNNSVILLLQTVPFTADISEVIQRFACFRNSHRTVFICDRVIIDFFRAFNLDFICAGTAEFFALPAADLNDVKNQGFRLVIHQSGDLHRQLRFCIFCKITRPFLIISNNSHRDLFDCLITVCNIEYDLKILVLIQELFVGQAHLCSARLGLDYFLVSVESKVSFLIQVVVDINGIAADFMFFTVIVDGAVRAGDGHFDLCWLDHQLAVHNFKGNLCEILVSVDKVICRQFHIIGPGIRTADTGISLERKVRRCIQLGILAVNLDARNIITGYGMIFTVVVSFTAVFFDSHSHINRINLLETIRHTEGDRSKVTVNILKLLSGQTHVSLAGVSPLRCCCAAEGKVCFLVERVADLCLKATDTVLCPVIICCVVGAGNGHCHIDRMNRQITVCNLKDDFGEIAVIVIELIILEAHVCGARICSENRRILVHTLSGCEVKIFFLVKRIADLCLIAVNAVLSAVIRKRAGTSGNRHHHFVYRCDGLIAVCNFECHIFEVFVCVRELVILQAHLLSSDRGLCGFRRSAEGEILAYIVQITVCLCSITAHLVLFSIINRGVIFTGDGNFSINCFDCLESIRNLEGHSTKVKIGVRKLPGLQPHVCGAGVYSFRLSCTAESKVGFLIQRVIDLYIISADGMLSAVIRIAPGMTGDGHRYIDRFDNQLTVNDRKAHLIKIPVYVLEVFRFKLHVIAACVSGTDAYFGFIADDNVFCHIIQFVVSFGCISGHRTHRTIIIIFTAVFSNRNCDADGTDGLITVRYVKGDCAEVGIRVGKLLSCQAHMCGPCICSCCAGTAAEGKVVFNVIQDTVCCRRIARHVMPFTIICGRIVHAGNGNCHVNRFNCLIAVCHLEGNSAKVGVGVGKLAGCQSHVRGTRVLAGRAGSTAESEVVFNVIQIVVCCRRITRHSMCFTVIIGRIVHTGNGNRYVNWLNRLITVSHQEGNSAEIFIGIGKLISRQAHLRSARLGP